MNKKVPQKKQRIQKMILRDKILKKPLLMIKIRKNKMIKIRSKISSWLKRKLLAMLVLKTGLTYSVIQLVAVR